MITEWGMSEKLGPLTFGKKSEEVFLGREISHSRDYSDVTSQLIDDEIIGLVKTSEKNADSILNLKIDQLHSLAEALLEYETISGLEMKMAIEGESIKEYRIKTSPPPRRRNSRRRSAKRNEKADVKANKPREPKRPNTKKSKIDDSSPK